MMQIKLVKDGCSWSVELHVANRIFRERLWLVRPKAAIDLARRIANQCVGAVEIIDENGRKVPHD